MNRDRLAWAIAAALASTAAYGETPQAEEDVEQLPGMIVEDEAPQSPAFQSSPIEDLKIGVPADAADLLRSIPGISGSRMGGHGIEPIIRGQMQNRLNILLDGAYVHGGCPNRMDPPTAYTDIDSYDEVTVIKGSQTVRYGGGGSGGSVLFRRRTERFQEGESLRGKINGGLTSNSQTKEISADLAAGTSQGFIRGLASYKDADNYEDGDGNSVRSAYTTKNATVIGGWTPADDQRLELSFEATRERDVLFAGAGMDSPISDNDTWRLRYEQEDLPGSLSGLNLELYNSDIFHRMDNFSLRTQTAPRKMLVNSDSDTTGGRISTDIAADTGTWTLGLDYQHNERDAVRLWDFMAPSPTVIQSFMWPGVELDQPGIFAELALPVGASDTLTGGLRYDRVDASVDQAKASTRPSGPAWQRSPNELYRQYYGVSGKDAEEDNIGGFLRYEHALNPAWSLSGSISRSVRTADATERYLAANNMNPMMRWIGNPGLEPEKHHQVELGLSGGGRRWNLAASIFYNQVDDYILRDRARGQEGILLADGATIYRNVEARLFGGEIEAAMHWNTHWSSRLTLAYVEAQNRDDDRPIAQTPPLEGSLGLEYAKTHWRTGALVRFAAEQNRVDTDPTTGSGLDARATPGWAVLDLYADFDVGNKGEIKLGVNNVFDNTYAYHVNRANTDPFNPDPVQVNEPGREFWVRAKLDF